MKKLFLILVLLIAGCSITSYDFPNPQKAFVVLSAERDSSIVNLYFHIYYGYCIDSLIIKGWSQADYYAGAKPVVNRTYNYEPGDLPRTDGVIQAFLDESTTWFFTAVAYRSDGSISGDTAKADKIY